MPDALVNPHVPTSADERVLFAEGYDLDGILTLDRATPEERRRAIGALTAPAA